MSVRIRWSRPTLTVSEEAVRRRRNLDRIGWRDVLDAVGRQEMELRRLHTATSLKSRHDLYGSIALEFTVDRDRVTLHHADADPAVKPLLAGVARLVVGADFKPSQTPMRVQLVCTFERDVGWATGEDVYGGSGREDRAFGDPF